MHWRQAHILPSCRHPVQTRARICTPVGERTRIRTPTGEWLRLYAHNLAQHGSIRAVRELCDELLGPIVPAGEVDTRDSSASATWEAEVGGLSKRALLKEKVLPCLIGKRSLQRVVAEYIEMLKACD